MKRLISSVLAGLLWIAATPGVVRADDTLKKVQQSLRDQGFYYGTIDGSPGDETTQAIRRYQIRNGLQVTGQLTDETRTSILRTNGGGGGAAATPGGRNSGANDGNGGVSVSPGGTVRPRSTPSVAATPRPVTAATPRPAAQAPTQPARTPSPTVRADPDDGGGFRRSTTTTTTTTTANPPVYRSGPQRDDDDQDAAPSRPGTPDRYPRDDRDPRDGRDVREGRVVPADGVAPSLTLSRLFADTPYEFAPPPVQADTLRRAQNRLFRQGFYDREGTGRPDAVLPEAISNFQGFNRLRRTGRLDTATLAALRLSPERGRGGPNGPYGDEGPRRGPAPSGVYEGRLVQ